MVRAVYRPGWLPPSQSASKVPVITRLLMDLYTLYVVVDCCFVVVFFLFFFYLWTRSLLPAKEAVEYSPVLLSFSLLLLTETME